MFVFNFRFFPLCVLSALCVSVVGVRKPIVINFIRGLIIITAWYNMAAVKDELFGVVPHLLKK